MFRRGVWRLGEVRFGRYSMWSVVVKCAMYTLPVAGVDVAALRQELKERREARASAEGTIQAALADIQAHNIRIEELVNILATQK